LPAPVRNKLLSAIRGVLRPVVRYLIASGITFPTVNRMLKELYVQVAETEFALPFKRLTDSRVSLVTGINRKEVSQLRRRKRESAELRAVEGTTVTRVLGRWAAGPPYASADGAPRRLVYESTDPKIATFASLVRELGPDVPVRSVLDELVQIGAAELSGDGHVTLLQQTHIPATGVDGKLTLLGSDPGELFATIVHNISEPDDPRLQRKAAYDNIGSDALPELRQKARELGEEFIRRANSLLASYDRDRNPAAPGGKRSRYVLGTYVFEEEVEPGKPTAAPSEERPPGRIRKRRNEDTDEE
jgi:hypothetical protein